VIALEEPRIEVLLELLHLERDRRLRHEKLLRGFGEAQLLRHGIEDLEASVSHRDSCASRAPTGMREALLRRTFSSSPLSALPVQKIS
jgi:hypothetical protein